jgi:hypothetical protein
MRRRGELFKSQGVQDIAAYRNKTGAKLPRSQWAAPFLIMGSYNKMVKQ